MNIEKVSPEVAKKEVDGYLDYKRVSEKKREEQKESIETLVDGIISGTLSIDESKNIVHTLIWPIENSAGQTTIDKLTYKPRLTAQAINLRMKSVKGTDVDGRIMGYASALTNTSTPVLGNLDTEDLRICQAVVSFFI